MPGSLCLDSSRLGRQFASSTTAKGAAMKADIHPNYRAVVFHDVTSDFKILTKSTIPTKETVKWEDGQEYPLVKVEISSASHPFYTGKHKVVDTGGRIDKFQKRYQKQ